MTSLGRILAELAMDNEFAYRLRLGDGGLAHRAVDRYLRERGVSAEVAQILVLAYLAGAMHATESFGRRTERELLRRTLAS